MKQAKGKYELKYEKVKLKIDLNIYKIIMRVYKIMNTIISHNKRISDSGIDHIFQHEKCGEFNDATKKDIITAHRLAVRLHK